MSTGDASQEPQRHWALQSPKLRIPQFLRSVPSGRVVAVGIAAVVLTVLFGLGLLHTSLFAVERIDVNLPEGSVVSKEDVLKQAKLNNGMAMISINESAVERRLETSPWIRHAHVKSAWPHVVTISVEERQPIAVLQTTDGKFAQVGSDGVVLGVTPLLTSGLPFVLDVKAKPEPGSLLDSSTQDLMTVAESLPTSLRPHVKQIQNQDNTLKLGLDTNTVVILGDSTDMALKLTAAASVVSHTDVKQLKILDVRSPHMPVATPVNGPKTTVPTGAATTTSTTISNKSKTSTTLTKKTP